MLLFRLHNVHLIWYEVSFSTDISVQERLVAKDMKKIGRYGTKDPI